MQEIAEPLPPLRRGRLIARPNRFLAQVELDGAAVAAHVADPGRLEDLLVPGAAVYVAPAAAPGRRTAYDLRLVEGPGVLVSVDSRVPNRLVARALAAQAWPEFAAYSAVRAEPRFGRGRFDFLLRGPGLPDCFIEVKGCTLVREGTALFPDAPTVRGARHLEDLAKLTASGHRAAVIFIVQRADAQRFRPHRELDPTFTAALRAAAAAGVVLLARRTEVTRRRIALTEPLPVLL